MLSISLCFDFRLTEGMVLLLLRWVRTGRIACSLVIEEISLVLKMTHPPDRVLFRVVSSVASLLRFWTVRQLDLTVFSIPVQGVTTLLLHRGVIIYPMFYHV